MSNNTNTRFLRNCKNDELSIWHRSAVCVHVKKGKNDRENTFLRHFHA